MGGVLPSQATQRNSQETFSPKITHSIARRPQNLNYGELIELSAAEKKARKQKQDKLESQIKVLSTEIEEIKNNKIYTNSLEWRFEFPEVLDSEGRFVGFDVVIGNPPYIRQEEIKDIKPSLKSEGYECFNGSADLLVYFYERSVKLLRKRGELSLITSNKFYRAGYGEALREFLAKELTLHTLVDFGDAPVFEAIAYASILSGIRSPPSVDSCAQAYTWDEEIALDGISHIIAEHGQVLNQSELKPTGWQLEPPEVLRLLEKLRGLGKPLEEFVNGQLYRGILTGLNEAFVVDRATRDRLIKDHQSSAEVLKPFLRGRDVKRWRVEEKDLWLIFTRRGTDIKKYPAIEEYLIPFKKQLMPGGPDGRKAGSYEWYEIQDNIAYYQEFEKPKIVIPAIEQRAAYALDLTGHYSNDKTSICITDEPKYLLGLLNSNLLWWVIRKTAASKQGGFFEFKPMYVSKLPIVDATPKQQNEIIILVDQIIVAKENNSDLTKLENQLNQLVYKLYGLSSEEINILG